MRDARSDSSIGFADASALSARIGGAACASVIALWWLGGWWRNIPPAGSASPFSEGYSEAL